MLAAKAVIIVGPHGCGKTLHREALRQMLGCDQVVDPWVPADGTTPGALHLTHVSPADALPYRSDTLDCYTFEHAMRMLCAHIGEVVAG